VVSILVFFTGGGLSLGWLDGRGAFDGGCASVNNMVPTSVSHYNLISKTSTETATRTDGSTALEVLGSDTIWLAWQDGEPASDSWNNIDRAFGRPRAISAFSKAVLSRKIHGGRSHKEQRDVCRGCGMI
jgi:hypothetical protein